MSILLIAPFDKPQNTAYLILSALRSMSIDVKTYDYRAVAAEKGLVFMNGKLSEHISKMGWDDLVIVIKGECLDPGIFRAVKPKKALWYFDFDSYVIPEWLAGLGKYMTGVFLMCYPWVNQMRGMGINAFFLPQGTDPMVYHPVAPDPKFTSDIAFIGGNKPGRIHLLEILKKNFDLKVWGEHWQETDFKPGVPAYLDDFNKVCSSSKIIINVTQSSLWPVYDATFSQRIYMVLAAGGFLMTDFIPNLSLFFGIGRDLVGYENQRLPQGFINEVQYWLDNSGGRTAIRLAGRERILREHTYTHRLRRLLECLNLSPSVLSNTRVSQQYSNMEKD